MTIEINDTSKPPQILGGETSMVDDIIGAGKSAASAIGAGVTTMYNNAANARMAAAGLINDLVGNDNPVAPTWFTSSGSQIDGGGYAQCTMNGGLTTDWRVRIAPPPSAEFMNSRMLSPLVPTSGVIFPILPQVQITHTARYSSQSLTHSISAAQFYEGSEISAIQINGEFPIQDNNEGQYLLAAIQFFRVITKMYFGSSSGKISPGTPPPLVRLYGFGEHYFPGVTCVVSSFTHVMPPDVDYIDVQGLNSAQNITRLPTLSQLQVELKPVYSRAVTTQFDLDKFASGDLLNRGFI